MTDQTSSPAAGRISPEAAAALMEGDEWPEEMERERGILSDTDRQFLWGVKDYDDSPSTVSQRRGTIRDRFVNGFLDLSLLDLLNERQRESIVERLEQEGEVAQLRQSVADLVAFAYREMDGDTEWLEETLMQAIDKAEREMQPDDKEYYTGIRTGFLVDVDVEIDVDRGYDVDEIEERFRSGYANTLTPAEVGVLVREGRVDPDELDRLDFTQGGDGVQFPEASGGEEAADPE